MKDKMTCEALLQYLSDYIDQELDEDFTQEAQEHLSTCENCRVVLNTTQKTLVLFREQGRRTIPVDRKQRLYRQLEEVFLMRKKQ